jgi:hypothetical protein
MRKIGCLAGLILLPFAGFSQQMTEILGRPTNNAITMSILFDQKEDVYWEYGTVSGKYVNATSNYTAAKDTTLFVDFMDLNPGTKYFYRTRYRANGSSSAFTAGPEHTFYTQRATGSIFTFTIEADEHLYDKKGVRSEYQVCLANQAKDNPDFMFTLGDIFGDDHNPTTITSHELDSLHKDYRQYLGQICHSIPFFICIGNHEGEKDYYLHQTPPNNMAVYGTLWRKFYYANPFPNGFYTGNTEVEGYGMGKPENYYAYTWGDALFVILDVYRYDSETSAKPGNWGWTLGQTQYDWLKTTLETSTSKYKFVFAHHVSGEGRGGIVQAKKFEWGGYEADGVTYGFTKNRPNMAKPIHQLFVDNKINVFFQGHDHLFAHEVMDGVIYQEVPMPSDSTYEIGMLANADAYVSDTIGGSGHIRVSVSPSCVNVDFVRAYLPANTISGIHHNREVAFSYTIGDCQTTGLRKQLESPVVKVYPNPSSGEINISTNQNSEMKIRIQIITIEGRIVTEVERIGSGCFENNINLTLRDNAGNELKPGIYIIRLLMGGYEIWYGKIVVK